ncbi:hypothetical protein, partial [Bacillus licheniformis]|uniref:hypothetical protein n=1 Tax=Bacillus licheniformis TaxID=1402 RepID=UPI0015A50FD9
AQEKQQIKNDFSQKNRGIFLPGFLTFSFVGGAVNFGPICSETVCRSGINQVDLLIKRGMNRLNRLPPLEPPMADVPMTAARRFERCSDMLVYSMALLLFVYLIP